MKREAASCWMDSVDPEETILVPGVGGREASEIPRRKLCAIVQPRMEEIFILAKEKLEKSGWLGEVKSGIVLTGGTAALDGIRELAEFVFGLPVRIGVPSALVGLEKEYRNPAFSAAIGLVLLEADLHEPAENPRRQSSARKDKSEAGSLGKLLKRLKEKFV